MLKIMKVILNHVAEMKLILKKLLLLLSFNNMARRSESAVRMGGPYETLILHILLWFHHYNIFQTSGHTYENLSSQ